MSVSIGNQGSQIYVELNHNGKSVQIPCENQEQAQTVAKAAEKAEAKIIEKEKAQGINPTEAAQSPASQQMQAPPVNLTQSTPPAGVGEKLDIKAA